MDGPWLAAERSRAVIVSASGAWDRLVDTDNALVLVADFDDADVASALRKGHHVVIPVGRDARHDEGRPPAPAAVPPQPAARPGQRPARC
jgi:hypothetical protein